MKPDDVAELAGHDTRTQWQPLRCGPLTMHFDPTTGALRSIRLGDREVVRSIYVAVRDRNWDTIEPQMADLTLDAAADGFRLTFMALCREREIDFRWQGEIVGAANGSLRYSMRGEARSTFLRNRIGFCILHPIRECAGRPCIVTEANGEVQHRVFPRLIAPHQPFLNMRAIRHEALPGVWAELTFEGDIFEMEDQRNWTDASYKTYCTPLSLPYPVEVPQETRIAQGVTLTLAGELPSAFSTQDEQTEVVTLRLIDAAPIPLPRIGLSAASHHAPLSDREIDRLTMLGLAHLRLDLVLAAPGWDERLQRTAHEASAIDAKLEIALFLPEQGMETRLAELAEAVKRLNPDVVRWLVFHAEEKTTPERCMRAARSFLAPLTPDARFGGGTNAYFAELNRHSPPKEALDFVCWSINPQVHAFDTASLMENLEAQAETVRSARALYGDLPIVLSPITLKPRFNPNATGPETPPAPGELPPPVDERQCTLIGAAWTLGSLRALCESGVESVTYYETTGWRGVMECEAGSPLPAKFPSVPGAVFPLYHVLAGIGQMTSFAGGDALALESSAPAKVVGLAFIRFAVRAHLHNVALCANLTPSPQAMRLLIPAALRVARVWQLDTESIAAYGDNFEWAFEGTDLPIEIENGAIERVLPPYAIVRLYWLEVNHD